jgi:hypothetical protein
MNILLNLLRCEAHHDATTEDVQQLYESDV